MMALDLRLGMQRVPGVPGRWPIRWGLFVSSDHPGSACISVLELT